MRTHHCSSEGQPRKQARARLRGWSGHRRSRSIFENLPGPLTGHPGRNKLWPARRSNRFLLVTTVLVGHLPCLRGPNLSPLLSSLRQKEDVSCAPTSVLLPTARVGPDGGGRHCGRLYGGRRPSPAGADRAEPPAGFKLGVNPGPVKHEGTWARERCSLSGKMLDIFPELTPGPERASTSRSPRWCGPRPPRGRSSVQCDGVADMPTTGFCVPRALTPRATPYRSVARSPA